MSDLVLAELPPGIPPADAVLAVHVYNMLTIHYPNHRWRVTADHHAGVVTIQLLYMGVERREAQYGWVLHISRLNGDPGLRAVIKAGGELLERFHLPRGPAPSDVALRALETGFDGAA